MNIRVQKNGRGYLFSNPQTGQPIQLEKRPTYAVCAQAVGNGELLQKYETDSGNIRYRRIPDNTIGTTTGTQPETALNMLAPVNPGSGEQALELPKTHEEVISYINDSISKKPEGLKISDLKWKYLVRSAVRGKNIMMTGPSGTGKTFTVSSLVKALDRPYFYFNLGATQDPRSTLVGNTHFNKNSGTFFAESVFVKAIKTPGSIILLDEVSRAHPDAWNILMTVLDEGQRYLRLDEAEGAPTIPIAEGVTFIATANIGHEYTSTRVMDRALMDRFTIIEMEPLNFEDEVELLHFTYPEVPLSELKKVADVAIHTRDIVKEDTGVLTTMVSTRMTIETVGLIWDGFTFDEAAQISILPTFSADGGAQSERTYILQLMEKFGSASDDEVDETESNLI